MFEEDGASREEEKGREWDTFYFITVYNTASSRLVLYVCV